MNDKEIQALQEQVALSDDQQAFKILFRHYYTTLFQFAVSIVKVREVAEEIVEDVFIKVWDKRRNLTEIANLRLYLYVAVKHHCLNHVTRRGNTTELDPDQMDVVCAELVPSPEDLLVASELLQRVNRSIHELPPKCRIVYKLVKENGLSYKEAGEILNISPRTVENHIAAALKKIASVLDADFPLPRKSFTLPGVKN